MSRKRSRYANWADPLYWTTQAWNWQATQNWYRELLAIAINRYHWLNLPDGVDVRFLETELITKGVASISWPDGLPGGAVAFAMQAVTKSPPDINGNYAKWESLGLNGKKWDTTRGVNGVLVYDSWTRLPQIDVIQFYAAELANIQRTMQTIRQHMRQPVIITAPKEQAQQINALQAQVANGAPYILTSDGFTQVDTQVLPTASGQESMQLEACRENLESTLKYVLNMLGISQTPIKYERQTATEIAQTDKTTEMIMLDGLDARRQAARELSELIGVEIKVVRNSDYETNSFDFEHDIMAALSTAAAPNLMSAAGKSEEGEPEDVQQR